MMKKLMLSLMSFLLGVSLLVSQAMITTAKARDLDKDLLTEIPGLVLEEGEYRRRGSDPDDGYAYARYFRILV